MDQLIIGITHANGLAAEAVLKGLIEIEIEKESIRLYSQGDSVGNRLSYGDHYLVALDQNEDSFEQCSLVMQLEKDDNLSEKISQQAPILLKQGGDSYFSAEEESYELAIDYTQSTFNLVDTEAYLALKLLKVIQQSSDIMSAQVLVLQPACIEGKAGIDELASQTVAILNARPVEPKIFPIQQTFNLFANSCSSVQNQSLIAQIKKNVSQEIQDVQIQSIQMPVFYGMTLMITAQCEQAINQTQLAHHFAELKGMRFIADDNELISPVTSLQDDALASISQLMVSEQSPQNVQFVITADHFRHGVAELFLNAMLVIRKTFL